MDVPEQMASLKQWLVWKYEAETKVPYQVDGRRGRTNDASTWSSLEEVQAVAANYSGIAFVFSEDDNLCGIDLDDCILPGGKYEPWAAEILEALRFCSYCEVSPSGTGVKFTTIGKKHEGSVCSNKAGVECYDHKRFWAFTGKCLGEGYDLIGEGQEAIDWLVSKHLTPLVQKRETVLQASIHPAPVDLMVRARAYADSIPGGSKGGLRNTAFKLSGNLHALAGDLGERLSDQDVFDLLQSWNYRNADMLRDDELREACVNGRKNGTPPAAKLPEVKFSDSPMVDLSEFAIGAADEPEKKRNPKRPKLTEDLIKPEGLLGDMVSWVLDQSRFQMPEIALASCLAFSGMFLGRKVRSTDGTRPNLFCLSIAESATGKNDPRKAIKRIMAECGIDTPSDSVTGDSALAKMLSRRPSVVMQIDEAGLKFREMKNPKSSQAQLLSLFSELFTASDEIFTFRGYADEAKDITIDQPHLSINATTTENQLYSGGFNHADIEQGFFGRFLIFRPAVMDPPERFGLVSEEPCPWICERIRSWWEFDTENRVAVTFGKSAPRSSPMVIPRSAAADARYRSYATAIAEKLPKEDPFQRTLWRRSKEKACRLALVHACLKGGKRDGIVIDKDSMDWGIAISNYSTRGMIFDMENTMVESCYQANVKYALSKIPPDGMFLWQFNKRICKFSAKERADILADLIATKVVVLSESPTSTKPGVIVRLAD